MLRMEDREREAFDMAVIEAPLSTRANSRAKQKAWLRLFPDFTLAVSQLKNSLI